MVVRLPHPELVDLAERMRRSTTRTRRARVGDTECGLRHLSRR